MGCGAMTGDDVSGDVDMERKQVNKRKLDEYKMKKEDVVECSACTEWISCDSVGVDGMPKKEVDAMDVYCCKCIHKVIFEMRNRISAYEQRVDDLENTVKTLSTIVGGNLSQTTTISGSTETSVTVGQKSPKRRNRRKNERKMDGPQTATRDYAAAVRNGKTSSSSEESVLPENSITDGGTDTDGSIITEEEAQQSSQEETNSDTTGEEREFIVCNRKKNRTKRTINIIGDSMIRQITRIIKCSEPNSGCVSKGGAGIKEIMTNATEINRKVCGDGYMILQGGGNSLKWLGVEETAKSILEGVDTIQNENKRLNIAVCSILPRPKENESYERMRRETNKRIQQGLCIRKAIATRAKEEAASFLDMDSLLRPDMYREDGVHLNAEGNEQIGKKALAWLKEKERYLNQHAKM